MPVPALTEIDDVAGELSGLLRDGGSKGIYQLEGPVGTGKSACISQIADKLLAETELKPITVSPPSRQLDTGAVALADVATGLSNRSLLNGELKAWMSGDKARWSERVGEVRNWVEKHNDEVVLLFDDPASWGASRDEEDSFRNKGFEAGFALTSLQCRRVIAGEMPLPYVHTEAKLRLTAPTIDPAWLLAPNDWGELAAAAADLAESELIEHRLTPLQVRLLIASTALTSIGEVRSWFEAEVDLVKSRTATRAMVARVAEAVRSQRLFALWDTWIRLSITRRPIDESILKKLTLSSTGSFDRDLIRHCLLFGEEEKIRMHDDVRHYALRWRLEHQRKDKVKNLVSSTTRELFSIHHDRFDDQRNADSGAALRESLEAYHFASLTGDSQLFDEVQPVFVEQLDALGYSLSVMHRDFEGAASAFERALEWEEEDDYAHHYLAYNLDRLGTRVDAVEAHFRRAAELKPTHSWWRSRLIIFLVGRGRISEARAEWQEALLDLALAEGDGTLSLYEHLHAWVAGALLDAGEPAFAKQILDEVPTRARDDVFNGLHQRAEALLQVGDGDAVVPAWRLRPGWWKDGPEKLQFRFVVTGEERVKWLAARVERKDKDGFHLRAAVVESDEEPQIAWTTIGVEDFANWCQDDLAASDLKVGSFLEVGLYVKPANAAAKVQTVIRVLPERPWETAGMSSLQSDRYLSDRAPAR